MRNRLPSHVAAMIRRFGWIYGVKVCFGGLLFTAVGCFARFMFRQMIFGFGGGFGSSDSMPGLDVFSDFNRSAWSVVSSFTGLIIGVGVILMIFGAALAVVLKRWGSHRNKDK